MADGFDIHIDKARAQRLEAVAAANGMSLTDFALGILDSAVSADTGEDDRRWSEYERTGQAVSLVDAIRSFDEAIVRGQAKHAG